MAAINLTNLTEIMSLSNLSNLTPMMNLAVEAPKYTGSAGYNNYNWIPIIIIGVVAFIFGYVVKDEIKESNKGICPSCNNKSKLFKCVDKTCDIEICEPCNLKDNRLAECGICGKHVCKAHYGTTHIHKKMGILFHGAKAMINESAIIQEPEPLLQIEYHGENKEYAIINEPDDGKVFGTKREEREILANTLLKLREEGYNLKGYASYFYIMEKQGNILPTLSFNEELPKKLENYDFEEMDPPAKIEWH